MSLGFRPTFHLEVTCSSREVRKRLQARLGEMPVVLGVTKVPGGGSEGDPISDHFTLSIPEADQHFWSPWLNLEIAPHGSGTQISGRFSPHPSVWTGFMFAYLALSVLAFFALVFAAALSMSGGAPWTLGLSGLCVAAMILLWWASQVGQRLAQSQMAELRGILDSALGECGWTLQEHAQPLGEATT
ncbi:MAG: hypothetical protein AB7K71_33955 [Polyangiaceae bacterium]